MITVAVTGASGYLGRKVSHLLGDDPDVGRVIGIDIVEPDFSTRNLEFYRLDVRSPELSDVIAGCDAIVHLATNDSAHAAETFDINVGGTRSVIDAAGRSAVGRLVFISSVAVYGAHPDNDFPLTEESAIRPLPDDSYGRAKAEAEGLVDYFARAHPEIVVTTLRPAWICGPSIPTVRSRLIDAPFRLTVSGYDVPTQAVHEDDAAAAVGFALSHDLPGAYNVCASDWVEAPEGVLGQRRVNIGLDRARGMLARAARVGLSPLTDTDLPSLMYPRVMSNAKLTGAGFEFKRSSAEAMREAAAARRQWVAVGRMQFRPRRLALVAGTFGAVLIGSAVRRRRPKREKA